MMRRKIERTGRYLGKYSHGTKVRTPKGIGIIVGETGYTEGYGTVYAVKIKNKIYEWTGDFLKKIYRVI